MNKRKDQLRSLFGVESAPETKSMTPLPTPDPTEAPKRSAAGAVRAMGLSLGALSQEIEDARRLRDSLEGAERVIDLDAARIERSPFADRLSSGSSGDEQFDALKRSIAEHGQQVPVLVRPHPDAAKAGEGIYQAAYGHRRIEAARQSGQPVRAIVKAMSDVELATAQGKENAERRNLTYVERAFFADALLRHGFDRATAMTALAVDKTELSRLLKVSEAIPAHIARAIGPAPKVGRPRWLALGALLQREAQQVKAADEIALDRFRNAGSDTRFQLLFDRLSVKAPRKAAARAIQSGTGGKIAEVQRKAGRAVFVIPASAGTGFADFLESELPRLHADFGKLAGQGE